MRVRWPILRVLLAFVQAGVTSGIIFGWPALQMVLTEAGAFAEYCKEKTEDKDTPCSEQHMYFNTIYTVAIFANNISPLFTGIFLDKLGPRWTSFVSFLLFFGGCGLFVLKQEHAYIPAYALLGFSGPGIYVSIMHLSNLFPGHQSFILSFFSGTFAVSSLVFKIFSLVYRPDSWFDLPHLFIALIVILIPFFIVGTIIWPNTPYEASDSIETEGLLEEYSLSPSSSTKLANSQPLYNAPVQRQLASGEFWAPVIWISFQALHIHSYVGTVDIQFADTPEYISIFNWIWLGGAITIPFFGVMLDKKGTTYSFWVSNVLFLAFSICAVIPVQQIQYVTFFLVSVANVGVWGILYSYLSFVFGTKNYGKVLGLSCGVIALVGVLQYPLLSLTVNWLNYNFTYVNVFFLVITILCFYEPVYLWCVAQKKSSVLLDDVLAINESEDDDDPLLGP